MDKIRGFKQKDSDYFKGLNVDLDEKIYNRILQLQYDHLKGSISYPDLLDNVDINLRLWGLSKEKIEKVLDILI